MTKLGVILLSGGLDSTTVAAWAITQQFELTGLTVHYGQRHSKEVQSARKVARILGIQHKVINVSFFKRLAWYSALTSVDSFAVPRQRDSQEMTRDIPITYVPLRNTFFITMAAAFVESKALDLIERQGIAPQEIQASIIIAVNAIDYSGYPDCRPDYYVQMSKAIFQGSKLGAQYERPISIETPLILKSKAEIVRMGMELGAPLEYTWSCYEAGNTPCGQCDSCHLRARGFTEAGYKDPLITRLEKDGTIAKSK